MQTDYAVEYEKACTAYSNGEYDEAASIINQLVLEQPEEPKFWLLQGHIYYVLTQYDVAAARYEWVLNITDDPMLVEEATQGLEYARAYALPDEGGSVFEADTGSADTPVPDVSTSSIFSEASTEEYAEYLEELQDGDIDLDYESNGKSSISAHTASDMDFEMPDDFSGSTEEYPPPTEEPLFMEELLDADADEFHEGAIVAANAPSDFDDFEDIDLELETNSLYQGGQDFDRYEEDIPEDFETNQPVSRNTAQAMPSKFQYPAPASVSPETEAALAMPFADSAHEWLANEEELMPFEDAGLSPQEAPPALGDGVIEEPLDDLANPFAQFEGETTASEAALSTDFDLGPFAMDEELLAAVEETEWSEPEESDLPDFLPGSEMPDLLGMPELEIKDETPTPPVVKYVEGATPKAQPNMDAPGAIDDAQFDEAFAQFDEATDDFETVFPQSDSDLDDRATADAKYKDHPGDEDAPFIRPPIAVHRFPPTSNRGMADGEEATLLMGMQDLADAAPTNGASDQQLSSALEGRREGTSQRSSRRRSKNIEPVSSVSDEDADLKTFVSGGFGASADLSPTRMVPLHDHTDPDDDFDAAFGSKSYGASDLEQFKNDFPVDIDSNRRSGSRASKNGATMGSGAAAAFNFSDEYGEGEQYGASTKNTDFLDEDEFFDDVNIPNFDLSEDTTGSNTTSSGFGLSTAMPAYFDGTDAGSRAPTSKDSSGLIGTEEFVSIGTTGENLPFYGDFSARGDATDQSEPSLWAFLGNASMGKKWLWVSLIGGAASAVAVAIVSHATSAVPIPQVKDALMAVSGAAAAVLTTAGLGTTAASQMRRATDDLQRQFEAMSQGNFSARATALSEDEFGTLAHKFNLMARNIASVTAEVTRRAEEHEQAKEDLQRQVIRLLDDVEGAARGDLTVAAEVTADVLGAVADSFNLTIQNLREIVLQVKLAARQVAKSATDSENFARALSSDALRQAEELAATLNSVQVMTDAIQRVAESAKEAEDVARSASEIALRGGEKVEQTVAGILEVRETVAETTRKVKRLAESSQEISKIVALISAIASRTNLLALNASIEAARAGEAGRGFAIVADEVRLLADRSAKALKDIEQIVMQIQSETNAVMQAMEEGQQQVIQGTKLAEEAKRALESIIQVTNRIDVLVRSITADTVEQNETARAVAQVMQAVELTAQETSQESQKVSISLQNLVGVARDLLTSVERFRVDAGERH
ncbi:methyl-accepting chemotaxis protein [[Phormidium] sp. ETS-05]|uniref:methyl-accepting chemotaxis protein n=1 Tax=[Phormidium] sp. ETS-05 TaxID=222819 RepID=UPI001E59276F|nr:methyl-accepting chemotaxis protein [[Phormidium] sp. ETS-05]